MDVRWKAWTPATTEEKAGRIAGPLLEKVRGDVASLRIEPYPKTNGHVLAFTSRLEIATWADAVVALLSLTRSVGHGWTIHGGIENDLDLTTNRVSLVGVSMLSCRLVRDDQ